MKKALLISTVSRQFTLFERGNIEVLKELDYEIHCAANYCDATKELDELDIIQHHIDIQRSPFSLNQIKAFFQLIKLMKKNKFDLVHCHAPMGGVLGRICAKLTKLSPVIYTAHGFHFYEGAPLLNNFIYKTIEKICARYTDVLITMNNEDYNAAQKFKIKKNGKVYKIPGVGVDTKFIKDIKIDRNEKRKELGIKEDEFLMLSVGELISRKNHIKIIEVVADLHRKNQCTNIRYAICGRGILLDNLKEKCKEYGIEEKVFFLGFRTDVYEIMKVSDLFVFPSIQEGLPKSVMEAMAAGIPVVASKIRGNIDLINNNENGFVIEVNDIKEFSKKIQLLYNDKTLKHKMGKANLINVDSYDISKVNNLMKSIYNQF